MNVSLLNYFNVREREWKKVINVWIDIGILFIM